MYDIEFTLPGSLFPTIINFQCPKNKPSIYIYTNKSLRKSLYFVLNTNLTHNLLIIVIIYIFLKVSFQYSSCSQMCQFGQVHRVVASQEQQVAIAFDHYLFFERNQLVKLAFDHYLLGKLRGKEKIIYIQGKFGWL